jgi:thiol-disulfide isomerase/thioredoxin
MNKINHCCLAAGLMAAAASLRSAELGMPAPPLQIADYIKGGRVDLARGKGTNVFVVEFWATWCPPCVATIPLLTGLQQKYQDRGVVIVGISDEPSSKARPFVEKMGAKMSYVVAVDNDWKTSEAYLGAFGEETIPHAFIVDKEGRIVWHGSPLGGLEQVLEQVVTGQFNLEMAKRADRAVKLMPQYFVKASAEKADERLADLGREIVDSLAGTSPGALDQFAWTLLTHPRIRHRDLPLALRAAKLAYDGTGGNDPATAETYARALFGSGKVKEAVDIQKRAIGACPDDRIRAKLQERLQVYEAAAKQ